MKELLDPIYIPFHLVNILVMYLFLRFFIYKPVKKFMTARENTYTQTKETADNHLTTAMAQRDEAEKMLEDARIQAGTLVKEAGDLALVQQKSVLQTAQREADAYLAQARASLELDKAVANERMKKIAVQMAVDMSQMILAREINLDEHQKFIDEYLNKVG